MGFKIDGHHFCHVDGDILLSAKYAPERVGDLRWYKPGYGDLIEQRLEQVIVVPVDQCDLNLRVSQLAGGLHPAKTCANDDNMGEFLSVHSTCLLFVKYHTNIITK